MKKNQFVLLAAILCFILSCGSAEHRDGTAAAPADTSGGVGGEVGGTDSFCTYIPKDSANKMINSYLGSIHYPGNDSDLRSLIIDIKQLSEYLKSTGSAGSKPAKIKLMFAHSLNYINNGGLNQNCGYQSGDLTLVVALYDSAGNYIYNGGNKVMDHLQPCPSSCPSSGTAASNTLQ